MKSTILKSGNIEFQLQVLSPFIICFHHKDQFPAGNSSLQPVHYPKNAMKGNDFREDAPFRMYHGNKYSGFPYHPHRGFETVTVVTKGFIDHADGMHLSGRYGNGDVQWMTAGKGIQHSEMFPCMEQKQENPLELFQIWLNLPRAKKFVEPHYKMLWNEEIPRLSIKDANNRNTTLTLIHGIYEDHTFIESNPDSYAHDPFNHVNIWLLDLEPHAKFTLPAISKTLNRAIYIFEGEGISINDNLLTKNSYAYLDASAETILTNNDKQTRILLLDGEPLNEPVAAYGPFVMNTMEEIDQAYTDYQKTQFGGWPWNSPEPVHDPNSGRFATYPGGITTYPPKKNTTS